MLFSALSARARFVCFLDKFREKKTFNETAVLLVYAGIELILYPGILKTRLYSHGNWELIVFHLLSLLVVITEALLVTSTTCKFHYCNWKARHVE